MKKTHRLPWVLFFAVFAFLFKMQVQAASFPLDVSYIVDDTWSTGNQITVVLKNSANVETTSWTATFMLPKEQTISSLWNGTYKTNGQLVTVNNPTWGGRIPAGNSVTFGMIIHKPSGSTENIYDLKAEATDSSVAIPQPKAPTLNSISLDPSNQSSYTVSWNPVENAASYTLQQDISSSFNNPKVVAQGTATSRSFMNQAMGTYYYRVSASNVSGTSPFSNVQSVIINSTPQLNAPILQAILNASGENHYLISWNASQNAQGYILEEATDSRFSNPRTVFSGSNTSYSMSGKSLGTYYYRVIAFSGNIQSQPSNIQSTEVTQSQLSGISIIEGYWESWNSRVPIETIVNMKVDVIDIAFATFTATGNHSFVISGIDADEATLTQFIHSAHSAGKKVKISIGGATYGQALLLRSSEDALGMARAVTNFVQQYSLDGVDYDIEDYPAAHLQIALIQNTRDLLGSEKIITYTPKAPASSTQPYAQVIQGAHSFLDAISIMAYNYGSGYTYQQDAADLQSMGVPPSKIIIGLMPGADDMGRMTSLNDITRAANFVMENELGGIMFWDLNRDHENTTGLGVDAATTTAWNIIH